MRMAAGRIGTMTTIDDEFGIEDEYERWTRSDLDDELGSWSSERTSDERRPETSDQRISIRKEMCDERHLKTTMRLCWELREIDERFAPSLNKRRAIIAVSKQRTRAKRRPYSDNTADTTINHENDSRMQITAPKQQSAKGRMLGAWFWSIY